MKWVALWLAVFQATLLLLALGDAVLKEIGL